MAELAAGRVYELVKLEQKPAARAEQTRGPAPAGAAGAGGAGKESALRQPEPPPADGQGSTLATDRWRVAQKPLHGLMCAAVENEQADGSGSGYYDVEHDLRGAELQDEVLGRAEG